MLIDVDKVAADKASDVMNYYESLGMLIEYGAGTLSPSVEKLILDMAQKYEHDILEIFMTIRMSFIVLQTTLGRG